MTREPGVDPGRTTNLIAEACDLGPTVARVPEDKELEPEPDPSDGRRR